MNSSSTLRHIRSTDTWNSGGGVMLDIVELDDGLTLVVGEETVVIYRTVDDFWAEVEEQDASRRSTTLLRSTGLPAE